MKPYKPDALVKISRYQNYFPTLSIAIQQDIYLGNAKARKKELFPALDEKDCPDRIQQKIRRGLALYLA